MTQTSTRLIRPATLAISAQRRRAPMKDPGREPPPAEDPRRRRRAPVDDPKPDEPPIEPPDGGSPPVKEPPRRRRRSANKI